MSFDIIDLDYNSFKDILNKKKIRWQYIEKPDRYDIFSYDNFIKYSTSLIKNPDNFIGISQSEKDEILSNKADFEANYKPIANRPIGISGIEADYYVDGKIIELDENTNSGYVEFHYNEEVEIAGVILRSLNSLPGDKVEMKKLLLPGVAGPDYVEVGKFGSVYPLGTTVNPYKAWGTGRLPTYACIRVYFEKRAGSGPRVIAIDLEMLR